MILIKRSLRVQTLVCVLMLTLTQTAAQAQQPQPSPRYSLTVLGTLGGNFADGNAINDTGAVAGVSTLPGDEVSHAFLSEHGTITDLGTLGGPDGFTAEAPAINDRGTVVGFSDTSERDPNGEDFCGLVGFTATGTFTCHPFIWQNGAMTTLPTLGGNAAAFAINNRGQVVGVSETNNPDPTCAPAGVPLVLHFEPAVWGDARIQELPPFPGDPDGVAVAANDRGQVVGASGGCGMAFGDSSHALLWQDGTPVDLGNLGGAMFNFATGINNRGQVVRQAELPNGTVDAFLWQNGSMIDLGGLPGATQSTAFAINNNSQIVGFSFDQYGNPMGAWLWQDGVMTDLNSLIPAAGPILLLEALGISNSGQITGYGFVDGGLRPYVLTPCDRQASLAACDVARAASASARAGSTGQAVRQPTPRISAFPPSTNPAGAFEPAPMAPFRSAAQRFGLVATPAGPAFGPGLEGGAG